MNQHPTNQQRFDRQFLARTWGVASDGSRRFVRRFAAPTTPAQPRQHRQQAANQDVTISPIRRYPYTQHPGGQP